MDVETQIYKLGLHCRIDTRADEGLETTDHFSFHRLSLQRQALSRLQGEKKNSIVILMPSIVPRREAEQKAGEARERRQRKREKKARLVVKDRVDGT